MSDFKTVSPKPCQYGKSCKFLKEGKCLFYHPKALMTISPNSNTYVKPLQHQKIKRPLSVKVSSSHIKQMCKALSPVLEKSNRLQALVAPPPSKVDDTKGWVSIPTADQKIALSDAALAASELKAMVTMMRSIISSSPDGYKPVDLVLPISISFTNTAANICAQVIAVDPTPQTDWSSLQVLFDEYRFRHGEYHFVQAAVSNPPNTSNADMMLVFAWDPVDVTALVSVRNGCEQGVHKLFGNPNIVGAGGTLTDGKPLVFKYHADKDDEAVLITSAGAVQYWPGQWKGPLPNAGSNGSPDGLIKCYNANTTGTTGAGSNCTVGIMYYSYQFRIRK